MSILSVKKRTDSEMTQTVLHDLPGAVQQVAQLANVITHLRTALNKDLPIQHMALLLAVVQQPGISMQALMDQLGMPQGSVSRNVKLLSDVGRGYGLLRNEQDMVNRKQVVVYPTEKCVLLIETLCGLLQDEKNDNQAHVCRCANAN